VEVLLDLLDELGLGLGQAAVDVHDRPVPAVLAEAIERLGQQFVARGQHVVREVHRVLEWHGDALEVHVLGRCRGVGRFVR
jgi:hypothetical protein